MKILSLTRRGRQPEGAGTAGGGQSKFPCFWVFQIPK